MSYNGSGTFNINTTGQPVVAGTVISSSAFNALTTDLATGLTTAITKDGQTTTTARITFAQGVTSSLVTDSSSVSTGSIITGGGVGIAKALYVGTTANVAGAVTLGGIATFSAQPIFSSLTASSAVATDASKGLVSVTNTGTGNNVLATSPTITTPTISSLSSAAATALTLQSAGTTAITVDTSQNVLVGTTTTTNNIRNGEKLAVVTTGSGTQGGASLTTYSGTGAGSGVIIDIQRSRGTTDGSMTAVASGDTLGYLLFRGSDGTSFQDSSYITGQVDGAVSGGTVPGRLAFITSGSERMRIDSSGNVGIGSSTITSADGSAGRIFKVSGATNTVLVGETTGNGGFNALILEARNSNRTNARFAQIQMQTTSTATDGGLITFSTSATGTGTDITERMRIDSSGNLLVGQTSGDYVNSNSLKLATATNTGYLLVNHINGSSSGNVFVGFGYNGSAIGSITQNGTTNVAYNTSSDYRLKENIQPMQNALATVAQLKPVTYKWKTDGSDGQGFIAHELQAVVPDCVTGDKDGLDDDGNPKYQGVDTSFLVATLTAAIQELKAINDTQAETINALTARIVALESK